MAIRLYASGLLHKSGFEDGDILDDILYDAGFNDDHPDHEHLSFFHEILSELVERFIVPALGEDVKVDRIGTIHNPIRIRSEVTHELRARLEADGAFVDIPIDTILDRAKKIATHRAQRCA